MGNGGEGRGEEGEVKGREGDWCPPHDLFARRPCLKERIIHYVHLIILFIILNVSIMNQITNSNHSLKPKTPVLSAISPKFEDGHSLKRYVPELLVGVIFDVYDQPVDSSCLRLRLFSFYLYVYADHTQIYGFCRPADSLNLPKPPTTLLLMA